MGNWNIIYSMYCGVRYERGFLSGSFLQVLTGLLSKKRFIPGCPFSWLIQAPGELLLFARNTSHEIVIHLQTSGRG